MLAMLLFDSSYGCLDLNMHGHFVLFETAGFLCALPKEIFSHKEMCYHMLVGKVCVVSEDKS